MNIPALPKTVDELKAWRDQVATTPQGGAAVFAVALYTYSQDAKLGLQFLTLCIDQSRLSDGNEGVSGKQPSDLRDFRDRNGAKPWIASSMFQGTSAKDAYKMPPLPWTMTFRDGLSVEKDGDLRIYIHTTGADSPKPLRLIRNDKGIWKAAEWSSFQGNCRPPEKKVSDDL